jgi:hypothetical protein
VGNSTQLHCPKVAEASAILATIAGVFLQQTLPIELQLKIVLIR